ncbi:MAG: cytosine permease [Thaumarchaeota archaeon]|nr:cytosine permease [Nitrososphaerota archaeon]
MPDKPASVEKIGIEHVPDESRHGSPNRTFTLWFAANLTIADYVIGVLTTVYFGLTLGQAVPILLAGNLLGGLLLGLAAGMGPSLGFPQMLSSRASFGRRGNYIPGALNWVSTVGWFTVNTILAVVALQVVVPGVNFIFAAAAYVVIQALIAVYGHDFIHLFEKVMSVALGLLFLLIFLLAVPRLTEAFVYVPQGATGALSLGSIGLVLVVSFSYLMSWSPYASDYSRYLPGSSSRRRVLLLAMAGGAAASFAVEFIGALVGTLTAPQTLAQGYFGGLNEFAGAYGALAMATLILGAFAADALNLYTNSLSALVLDVRAPRWMTVAAGGAVGFIVAVLVNSSFEVFFENFLLALTYWIMPWLAIVLVDYYLSGRTTVESITGAKSFDLAALGIYGVSILVSIPFMLPLIAVPNPPFGYLAQTFGGADLSYFISFGLAAVLTYFVRMKSRPNAGA